MAVMTLKALLPIALLVTVAPASAQLSRRTFGGLPFWADSALVASGLGQRFILSSELNTISEFGDFDRDRKSTRLNSSHVSISYAVFCLKKKKKTHYTYIHIITT